MKRAHLSGAFAAAFLLIGVFLEPAGPKPIRPGVSAQEIESAVHRAQVTAGLDAAES